MARKIESVTQDEAKITVSDEDGTRVRYYRRRGRYVYRVDADGSLRQVCEGLKSLGSTLVVREDLDLAAQLRAELA